MPTKKEYRRFDSSILSNFPDLSYIGFEITKNGVIRAKRLKNDKKKTNIYK
jgi:tRNA G46 methylase TrmB